MAAHDQRQTLIELADIGQAAAEDDRVGIQDATDHPQRTRQSVDVTIKHVLGQHLP